MSLVFPKWTNAIPTAFGMGGLGATVGVIAAVTYWFTPKFWEVGYRPVQPVNYSHQIHVAKLGMDCRYCHTNVEKSPHANVPDTATCMNCHMAVVDPAADSIEGYLSAELLARHKTLPSLQVLRSAYEEKRPVQWRRIHKLPDYVQFNHSVHVNAGVSCYSCHGRIDVQAVVRQEHSLAMAWCLDCHRNPEAALVDTSQTQVTDLRTVEQLLNSNDQAARGMELAQQQNIVPPQNCGACHY